MKNKYFTVSLTEDEISALLCAQPVSDIRLIRHRLRVICLACGNTEKNVKRLGHIKDCEFAALQRAQAALRDVLRNAVPHAKTVR